jgi:hypothetical protein
MSDNHWTVEDDAAAAGAGRDETHPAFVALTFMSMITDLTQWQHHLPAIVTPESLDSWGDFTEIRDVLERIPERGLGSGATPATDAPDVAYVKIMRDVPHTFLLQAGELQVEELITLVWRPEVGRWLVHSVGAATLPEDAPRTSPGGAPSY